MAKFKNFLRLSFVVARGMDIFSVQQCVGTLVKSRDKSSKCGYESGLKVPEKRAAKGEILATKLLLNEIRQQKSLLSACFFIIPGRIVARVA